MFLSAPPLAAPLPPFPALIQPHSSSPRTNAVFTLGDGGGGGGGGGGEAILLRFLPVAPSYGRSRACYHLFSAGADPTHEGGDATLRQWGVGELRNPLNKGFPLSKWRLWNLKNRKSCFDKPIRNSGAHLCRARSLPRTQPSLYRLFRYLDCVHGGGGGCSRRSAACMCG